MIKKITILLFLFLFINIIITISKINETQQVFNYLDNKVNDYDIYVLSFDKVNLNTSNLVNYFKNFNGKILGVYPKINPLYENKIKIKYYSFDKKNLNDNINKFIEDYLSMLSNMGLNEEKEKIYLNGIKISKVRVYASSYEISRLIKKYSNITYK